MTASLGRLLAHSMALLGHLQEKQTMPIMYLKEYIGDTPNAAFTSGRGRPKPACAAEAEATPSHKFCGKMRFS